jgi:hypothetical protein
MVDLALLQSLSYIAGALGVCVAAVYYVLNLRITQKNQELTLKALEHSAKAQELTLKAQQQNLETRQAQLFMAVYQSFYSSDFTKAEFDLFKVKIKTAKDMEKLMKEDVDGYRAWNMYGTLYEGLGVLVREGLIDVRLPALLMSGMILQFWDSYRDAIVDARRAWKWPRVNVEVEYLAEAVAKYGREHPELGISSPEVSYVESMRT